MHLLGPQSLGLDKIVSHKITPRLAFRGIISYLLTPENIKHVQFFFNPQVLFIMSSTFFNPKTSLPNNLVSGGANMNLNILFSLFVFFMSHRLELRSVWQIYHFPMRFSLCGITCFPLISKCLPKRMKKKMRILYFNQTSHQQILQTW